MVNFFTLEVKLFSLIVFWKSLICWSWTFLKSKINYQVLFKKFNILVQCCKYSVYFHNLQFYWSRARVLWIAYYWSNQIHKNPKWLLTYILMGYLNISGDLVEGVIPPVVGKLLGGVVAHAARVKLQVRANGLRNALIRPAKAWTWNTGQLSMNCAPQKEREISLRLSSWT